MMYFKRNRFVFERVIVIFLLNFCFRRLNSAQLNDESEDGRISTSINWCKFLNKYLDFKPKEDKRKKCWFVQNSANGRHFLLQ